MKSGERYYLANIGNDPINEYLSGVFMINELDKAMNLERMRVRFYYLALNNLNIKDRIPMWKKVEIENYLRYRFKRETMMSLF